MMQLDKLSIRDRENMARAIARKRGLDPDANFNYGDKPIWKYFIEDVDAVLDCLRESSKPKLP